MAKRKKSPGFLEPTVEKKSNLILPKGVSDWTRGTPPEEVEKQEIVKPPLKNEELDIGAMGLYTVNPTPYMFRSSYDFQFEKNRSQIMENLAEAHHIMKKHELKTPEKDGGVTSVCLFGCAKEDPETKKMERYVPPHDWPCWRHFSYEWLPQMVDAVWDIWRLEQSMLKYVAESWLNVHPKGAFTDAHHHHNVQVAMACYLNVPEGSGNLMIQNPMAAQKFSEPVDMRYFETGLDWIEVPVKTNDVFFFPGWLEHKTQVNETDQDRYIMSLNIKFDYPSLNPEQQQQQQTSQQGNDWQQFGQIN